MNDNLCPWYMLVYRVLTCPLYYFAMSLMWLAITVVMWKPDIANEFWEEWKPSWDL